MKKLSILVMAIIFIFAGMTAADKLPASDDFVKVEKMPEMVKSTQPVYPEAEKKAGTEGDVVIKALVDKTGKVVEVEVAKTSGHEALDKAAVEAAYQNEFKPAMQDGKPVAIWVAYKVAFKLDDDKEKDKKGP